MSVVKDTLRSRIAVLLGNAMAADSSGSLYRLSLGNVISDTYTPKYVVSSREVKKVNISAVERVGYQPLDGVWWAETSTESDTNGVLVLSGNTATAALISGQTAGTCSTVALEYKDGTTWKPLIYTDIDTTGYIADGDAVFARVLVKI